MGRKYESFHCTVQFFMFGTIKPDRNDDRQNHNQPHKQHGVYHCIYQYFMECLRHPQFPIIVQTYKFLLGGYETARKHGIINQIEHRIHCKYDQKYHGRCCCCHTKDSVPPFTCAYILSTHNLPLLSSKCIPNHMTFRLTQVCSFSFPVKKIHG